MPTVQLKPLDIVPAVRTVLKKGKTNGKKKMPTFMTAYQILDRLPEKIKNQLIEERGSGGKNTGTVYAAASVVSKAAQHMGDVVVGYLDTKGLKFNLNIRPDDVIPSAQGLGIFRLKTPEELQESFKCP